MTFWLAFQTTRSSQWRHRGTWEPKPCAVLSVKGQCHPQRGQPAHVPPLRHHGAGGRLPQLRQPDDRRPCVLPACYQGQVLRKAPQLGFYTNMADFLLVMINFNFDTYVSNSDNSIE